MMRKSQIEEFWDKLDKHGKQKVRQLLVNGAKGGNPFTGSSFVEDKFRATG